MTTLSLILIVLTASHVSSNSVRLTHQMTQLNLDHLSMMMDTKNIIPASSQRGQPGWDKWNDRNVNSTEFLNNPRSQYVPELVLFKFPGVYRIERILIIVGSSDVNPENLNLSIVASLSLKQETCGLAVNQAFAIDLQEFTFTQQDQVAEFSLNGEALATSISLRGYNLFRYEGDNFKRPAVSEVVVIGTFVRPRPMDVNKFPTSTTRYDWGEDYYDANVPEKIQTDLRWIGQPRPLIHTHIKQACAFTCTGVDCAAIIGELKSGQRTKYVVTSLTETVDLTGRSEMRKLLKFYCRNSTCDYEYVNSVSELPAEPIKDKILILREKMGAFNANNSFEKVKSLLEAGQMMMFAIKWYKDSEWDTTNSQVNRLLDYLEVMRNDQEMKTADEWCWPQHDPRELKPLHVVTMSYQSPVVHQFNPKEWTGPIKSSERFGNLLKFNTPDYLNLWYSNLRPCVYRSVDYNSALMMNQIHLDIWENRKPMPFLEGQGIYPAMVDPSAPKDSLIIDLGDAYGHWKLFSSLVGTSAGQMFSIRVLNVSGGTGSAWDWRYRQSCNTDWLSNRPLPRFPRILAESSSLGPLNLELNSVYSGLMFISYVHGIWDNSTFVRLQVAVSGVYRTAIWNQKGKDPIKTWNKSKARTYFPHVEILGGRAGQCMELGRATTATPQQIKQAVDLLDKWVIIDWVFVRNSNPYRYRGEYFNYDFEIGSSFMHSGYPAQAYKGCEFLKGDEIQKNGAWGHCHEFGHNLDVRILDGDDEVTNNFLCLADYLFTKIEVEYPPFRPGTTLCDMWWVVKQWKGKCSFWCDISSMNGYLCYFAWKFGPMILSDTFVNIATTDIRSRYSGLSREDLFVIALSEVTNINMAPYHDFMGWKLADKTWNATNAISSECWLPENDEYSDSVNDLIVDYKVKSGRNCTVKSADRQVVGVATENIKKYLAQKDTYVEAVTVEFGERNQK